jgi:hypothetical protein
MCNANWHLPVSVPGQVWLTTTFMSTNKDLLFPCSTTAVHVFSLFLRCRIAFAVQARFHIENRRNFPTCTSRIGAAINRETPWCYLFHHKWLSLDYIGCWSMLCLSLCIYPCDPSLGKKYKVPLLFSISNSDLSIKCIGNFKVNVCLLQMHSSLVGIISPVLWITCTALCYKSFLTLTC